MALHILSAPAGFAGYAYVPHYSRMGITRAFADGEIFLALSWSFSSVF